MTDEKKKWIVLTSGDRSLDDISNELSQKGFAVKDRLDAIGQIIAEANDDSKKEGLKIEGVSSIDPMQDDIDIGNPDSEITW